MLPQLAPQLLDPEALITTPVVAGLAGLRKYAGKAKSVILHYGFTVGDNCGGLFNFGPPAAQTLKDDGGCVIVDRLSRVWLRQVDNVINAQWYGVVNDTAAATATSTFSQLTAFQAALTATSANNSPWFGGYPLFIPPIAFAISDGAVIGSVQCIIMSPGTIISATTTGFHSTNAMLNISGQHDVTIWGNGAQLIGNRDSTYPMGEYNHGVSIYGATTVRIDSLYVSATPADGFCIHGASWCGDVYLNNVSSIGAGRNGLTIANGINIWVCNSHFDSGVKPAGGASPSGPYYGIDVEPTPGYASTTAIQGVRLLNCSTYNNAVTGLGIILTGIDGTSPSVDILVDGYSSTQDGTGTWSGTVPVGAIHIAYTNSQTIATAVGTIRVVNAHITAPWNAGVCVDSCYYSANFNTTLENINVFDCNQSGTGGTAYQAGFAFTIYSGVPAGAVGGVDVKKCNVYDNRGTPQTICGAYMQGTSANTWQNVTFTDCYLNGYLIASNFCGAFTIARGYATPEIRYTLTPQFNYSTNAALTTTNVQDLFGYQVNVGCTSNENANLPLYSQWGNNKITFAITPAATASYFQILPNSADTVMIGPYTAGAGVRMSFAESVATFQSFYANTITATAVAGELYPSVCYGTPRRFGLTAAPASGTWKQGDQVWNVTPSTSTPMYWVCTVAGTPGTWVASPNL